MANVGKQAEHTSHAFVRDSFMYIYSIAIGIFASFAATVREDIFKKPATSEPLTTKNRYY